MLLKSKLLGRRERKNHRSQDKVDKVVIINRSSKSLKERILKY
jgi:hypothetical protein